MYFPYLYGRQSELLALRDFSLSHVFDNTVTPIIEPVRKDQASLKKALSVLNPQGFVPVVIVNPLKLDFAVGNVDIDAWLSELMANSLPGINWIPAFLVGSSHTANDIFKFILKFSEIPVAVVYNTSNISVADLKAIDNQASVIYQVNLANSLNAQQRNALSSSKAVDVFSCFNSQRRNANYSGVEYFSNQFNIFRNNSVGYGDFSVLANEVSDEGGRASAVAIHATYKDSASKDVYVEHFVSTITQRDVSDVSSKFVDAASKLMAAVQSYPLSFGNNIALDKYRKQVSTHKSPGLPGNKRQQILHHICLNRQMLLGQI